MRPVLRSRRAAALAGLAACALAGALVARLRIPLPWMIGPLVIMAAARFSGIDLLAPPGARPVGQVVIATSLGLYFTPIVVAQLVAQWWVFVAAGAFALALGFVGGALLARFAGIDRATAFLASVPGGATEMANLAARVGARVDRIAVAHSMRVLVVVLTIPFLLTALGAQGSDRYDAVRVPVDWPHLAVLLAGGAAAGALLRRWRSPNGWMFGPLAVTATVTALGNEWTSIPSFLTNAAQLLVGCSLGQLFHRDFVRGAPRFVTVVIAAAAVALIVSAIFGWALAVAIARPIATLVLATSPGGIAEMCITAKALQLGVPFVTAAHVTRVVMVTGSAGLLLRWMVLARA